MSYSPWGKEGTGAELKAFLDTLGERDLCKASHSRQKPYPTPSFLLFQGGLQQEQERADYFYR